VFPESRVLRASLFQKPAFWKALLIRIVSGTLNFFLIAQKPVLSISRQFIVPKNSVCAVDQCDPVVGIAFHDAFGRQEGSSRLCGEAGRAASSENAVPEGSAGVFGDHRPHQALVRKIAFFGLEARTLLRDVETAGLILDESAMADFPFRAAGKEHSLRFLCLKDAVAYLRFGVPHDKESCGFVPLESALRQYRGGTVEQFHSDAAFREA